MFSPRANDELNLSPVKIKSLIYTWETELSNRVCVKYIHIVRKKLYVCFFYFTSITFLLQVVSLGILILFPLQLKVSFWGTGKEIPVKSWGKRLKLADYNFFFDESLEFNWLSIIISCVSWLDLLCRLSDIETIPPDLLTLTCACVKLRMTQQPHLHSSVAGTNTFSHHKPIFPSATESYPVSKTRYPHCFHLLILHSNISHISIREL